MTRNEPVGNRAAVTAATVLRSRGVTVVCVVTVVMVVAHFVAYTYLAPLVRENGGLDGLALSALLLGYGGLSLLGNVLIGRIVDRHPGTVLAGSILGCVAGLTTLALVDGSVMTVVAVLVWGAGFAGIPLTLQAVILRVAPKAQDASSAVYVVAFQIGIGVVHSSGNAWCRLGTSGSCRSSARSLRPCRPWSY